MFRLKNTDAKFPPLYEHIERKAPTVKDKGWDKVGDFVLRDGIDLIPQEGLQENMCKSEANLIFICGQATSGKAQPYDANVLTPKGFVKMGELKVGDIISGFDGKPQTVLQIFEQGEKDIYRVIFEDGTSTECCDEHLWDVRVKKPHYAYKEMQTLQLSEIRKLMEQGKRIAVPFCLPQEFGQEAELPIDPYVLGLLLGNGHIRKSNTLFSSEEPEILDTLRSFGYHLRKRCERKCDYQISGGNLTTNLRLLGLTGKLSYDKFVPNIYKYSSPENRLGVIQGLMDTDGYADNCGHVEYSTSSKQLADDFVFMLRSLGAKCTINTKIPKFPYRGEKKIGHISYIIYVNFGDNKKLFRLQRKKDIALNSFGNGGRAFLHKIVKCEPSGKKQCRCILVSNEDSLYITDDFIVTHNTFSMMLKALSGVGKYGYTGRLVNVRKLDSSKGTSMFRDASFVWGDFSHCQVAASEQPTFVWQKWNNAIQMIHANFNAENPKEWDDFQEYIKKQQAAYIAIDEATAIEQFKMFTYFFSRNRDSSGVEPCMVLSFNPKYAHWTTEFLLTAGYINPQTYYLRPEMDGKKRYFYIKGDDPTKVVWGDTKEEVAEYAHIRISAEDREAGLTEKDMVKSFVLFTGTASGNRKLVAATKGQSVANLHNVGATQRAVLADAYFGPESSTDLQVTDQMFRDMMSNPINDDENMYATMDVSGGGERSDDNPIVIWKGLTIVGIEFFRGSSKDLVEWIDRILSQYGVPIEHFAFDATGIGYYLKSYTNGYPITANKTAIQEYDEQGNPVTLEQYFNLRSQLLAKFEVLIKTGAISTSIDFNNRVPYGKNGSVRQIYDILYDEKEIFRSTTRNRRIYYLSKDDYKSRFHCSPNLMDSMYLRAIWELDARPKKQPEAEVADDAYYEMYNQYGRGRSVIYI